MARTKNAKVPDVGEEAPEFNLPSAQGGNLRLGMRTARGPVIVAFLRGPENEEDVAFFETLAAREDEINLALGSIVGIGVLEPIPAREFVKASGIKSYILYDSAKRATPAWGLLQRDGANGDYALPATFVVDTENKIVAAWTTGRPSPDELLAKVSEITGLPKAPEEEKPKKAAREKKSESDEASGEASDEAKSEETPPAPKMNPEAGTSETGTSEKKDRGEGSE